MNRTAKLLIVFFLLLIAVAFIPTVACSETDEPRINGSRLAFTQEQIESVQTNTDLDEIIVPYEGFTVSFNPTMHLPNWVAWTITREEMENSTLPRNDNFRPDNNVPGCATLADYYRSGYDRGHMAPSGDMKWSAQAMDNACYLTNICPQLHALNNGAWKNLEEKCRKNATRDSLVVIICGPILTQGFQNHIGDTPVPVPPAFFKVVFTPAASTGPSAIGFIMPNAYVEGGMQAAAVSVDEVERLTGHDFFYLLPDSIETLIEADVDFNRFSTGKVSRRAKS